MTVTDQKTAGSSVNDGASVDQAALSQAVAALQGGEANPVLATILASMATSNLAAAPAASPSAPVAPPAANRGSAQANQDMLRNAQALLESLNLLKGDANGPADGTASG